MNNILTTLLVGTSLIGLEAHAMKRFQGDDSDSSAAARRAPAGDEGGADDEDAAPVQTQAGASGGGEVTDEQVEAVWSGRSYGEEGMRAALQDLSPEVRARVVELVPSLIQGMDSYCATRVIESISGIADEAVRRYVVELASNHFEAGSGGYERLSMVVAFREALGTLSKDAFQVVIRSVPKLFERAVSAEEKRKLLREICRVPEVSEEVVGIIEALRSGEGHQSQQGYAQDFWFFAGAFKSIPDKSRKRVACSALRIFTANQGQTNRIYARSEDPIYKQVQAIRVLGAVPMDVMDSVIEAGQMLYQGKETLFDESYLLEESSLQQLVKLSQEYSGVSFWSIVEAASRVFSRKEYSSIEYYIDNLDAFLEGFFDISSQNRVCMVEAASKFLKAGMELDRARDITRIFKNLAQDRGGHFVNLNDDVVQGGREEEGREGMLDAVVTAHSQLISTEASEEDVYELLETLARLPDLNSVYCMARYVSRFVSSDEPAFYLFEPIFDMLAQVPPSFLEQVATKASPLFQQLQLPKSREDLKEDSPNGQRVREAFENLRRIVEALPIDQGWDELEDRSKRGLLVISKLPDNFDWASYLETHGDVAEVAAAVVAAGGASSLENFAIHHYLNYGHGEKRAYLPSDFDSATYLRLHSDVEAAAAAGVVAGHIATVEDFAKVHYLGNGFSEKRRYLADVPAEFDAAAYLRLNGDVAETAAAVVAAGGASTVEDFAIQHYRCHGFGERRQISE